MTYPYGLAGSYNVYVDRSTSTSIRLTNAAKELRDAYSDTDHLVV